MKVVIFGIAVLVTHSIVCTNLVAKNITTYVASDITAKWYCGYNYCPTVEVDHSAYAHIKGAYWIWNSTNFSYTKEMNVTFTKLFNIPGNVTGASLSLAADNFVNFALINNKNAQITTTISHTHIETFDVTNICLSGLNNLTISVKNYNTTANTNPAGLLYLMTISSAILE